MDEGPKVFDLTPLTRGAAAQRRVVVQGFEVRWQILVISGLGLLPGALLAMLLWPLFGSSALFAIPVVIGGLIWLLEGRSKRGMRLRNWQSLKAKAGSRNGKFFVSGNEYDPLGSPIRVIQVRSVPVDLAPTEQIDIDELAPVSGTSRRPSKPVSEATSW